MSIGHQGCRYSTTCHPRRRSYAGDVEQPGRLDVICGPMFSGKTDELIGRFERARQAGRRVIAVKPITDDRHPAHLIVSHSRRVICAEAAGEVSEVASLAKGVSGLFVDEIQFFPPNLPDALADVRSNGVDVVAAGLDLDFRRQPFEVTASLVSRSSSVARLTSSCTRCGESASVTQRFHEGEPVPLEDPRLMVGDSGAYEPRCVRCWELERA